jgi:hypothetical protein
VQTHFADTLLNIALTGNLVRLDFGTVVPVPNAEGKQELRATATQQLVMPLEGFVRSFGMQEQLIKKLLADGVLKVQPSADNPAIVASGTTTPQ